MVESIPPAGREASRPEISNGREFPGDDAALVAALQRGDPGAPAALFDRHGEHVQRVLANVLGLDNDLPDLVHEVFARALKGIHGIREESHLKAWITRIAVFTARGHIRQRVRKRWLLFFAPEDLPEPPSTELAPETREALRSTYAVMDRMPADQRIAFSLRFVQGMKLKEVAQACDVSLATIKRRLSAAEKQFLKLARQEEALRPWIEEGRRWGSR